MAEHDATRADAELGTRAEVEPTAVPVEAAVSAGTGITGSDYGAAGGSDQSQTNLGVPLDDDGSYPSAMSGTTNANAHAEGVPQGRTDSIRDER
jgi:hypothetical protein